MNERFRELRKQAAREVSNANQWTNDDEWNELFMEKFAELIVAEVLAVQEKFIANGHNAWHLNKPTREHFGVEK
jgi:hypothetical protein